LQQNAANIIAATAAEMRIAAKYLHGARRQIADLLSENRKLSHAQRALASELHDANQARDAVFAASEQISQEREALSGRLNQVLQQHDAAIAERDDLARQREALVGECAEILAQRDAVIAERNGLSRELEALANDCVISAAECDRVFVERDRLAAESWRWFEATIAVGAAGAASGSNGAAPGGSRISLRRSPPRDLAAVWQRRRLKRLIAAARRASASQQWEIAARHYCDAIDCAPPRRAALWVQYGHALKEAGKLQAGEYAYRRSLECDDRVADTHFQLGHVLGLQNRASEAARSYLRALRLAPHLHDAIYGLLALGWTAETLRSELLRQGTPPAAIN
jgi:tetratricopeptide (TPR) repeat protein